MTGLSLATIALDEETLIGGMLASVSGLVQDVVVAVDERTTDATAAVVQQGGGRVLMFRWADDFSAARNAVLAAAQGDWALVLDPDERLTPEGRAIVGDLLRRSGQGGDLADIDGFSFVAAQCDLSGHAHALTKTSVRLFRLDPALRYRGLVHEEVWRDGPEPGRWVHVDGTVAMVHVGYAPELWVGRGKRDLYLRLLERRMAEDPADDYVRRKLGQMRAMGPDGIMREAVPA